MEYSVKIYSRIGELMQGFLPDTGGFLVSGLPSRLFYSEAILESASDAKTPALPPKTQQALSLFLKTHDPGHRAVKVSIRLRSNITPGKGLSSSSTDILCVLHVLNDYLGASCSNEELYRIAAAIEPTDPCLSENIVVFRQRLGIVETIIAMPPVDIVYFDAEPALTIDTETIKRTCTPGTGRFYHWLLKKFSCAAAEHNYSTLFDTITYSAEYNQTMLAFPRFDEWRQLADANNAGLMIAHSGTIAGLLLKPGQGKALQQRLTAALDTPVFHEQYPLL